jgi:hypothetical protein
LPKRAEPPSVSPRARTAAEGRAELVDCAFGWLAANLEHFDPLVEGGKPDALRNKALAELAFLCAVVQRAQPAAFPQVQGLVAFVSGVWSRAAYRDLIVRNPESLQLYALVYDSLSRCGVDVSDAAPVIESVIDAGYATSIEAVPFRLMDMRNVLDGGGFRHPLPPQSELFRHTLLASRPSLVYVTNADIYCLTHAIFYVTNFGFQLPTFLSPKEIEDYRATCDRLLGLAVRLRDWDLTSELLICAHCLGGEPTVIEDAAWPALAAAPLADGSVPAPGYDPDGAEARRSPEIYAFEHNYHTTLVAVLAAILRR